MNHPFLTTFFKLHNDIWIICKKFQIKNWITLHYNILRFQWGQASCNYKSVSPIKKLFLYLLDSPMSICKKLNTILPRLEIEYIWRYFCTRFVVPLGSSCLVRLFTMMVWVLGRKMQFIDVNVCLNYSSQIWNFSFFWGALHV